MVLDVHLVAWLLGGLNLYTVRVSGFTTENSNPAIPFIGLLWVNSKNHRFPNHNYHFQNLRNLFEPYLDLSFFKGLYESEWLTMTCCKCFTFCGEPFYFGGKYPWDHEPLLDSWGLWASSSTAAVDQTLRTVKTYDLGWSTVAMLRLHDWDGFLFEFWFNFHQFLCASSTRHIMYTSIHGWNVMMSGDVTPKGTCLFNVFFP